VAYNNILYFKSKKDFDRKKDDLLNIYIKKCVENNSEEYYLYIFNGVKEKKLNKFPKIKSNTTYYLIIYILIFLIIEIFSF